MAFNLLGDIVANDGESWADSDVKPAMVIGWLAKQDGDVEININSNGGDVSAGLAIANAIRAYDKGKVICNVLGIAASMASVVACAGDELRMGEGTFLMVHNPFTVTMGTADDLRKDADTLDKMRDAILGFYQSKSSKTADEIKAAMDAETWMTRDEARAFGFAVSDYAGEFKAAAAFTRRSFGAAPEAARAFLDFHAEKPAEPKAEKPADNWEARFKGLSQKFSAAQSAHSDALAAKDVEIKNLKGKIDALETENDTLKSQLEHSAKDLAAAKDHASELAAKLKESDDALLESKKDLAQTRDSLKAAEDKAAHLESTRDMLTAGVLTPPSVDNSYDAKMKAAKTAEEREALRAAKKAGKIK